MKRISITAAALLSLGLGAMAPAQEPGGDPPTPPPPPPARPRTAPPASGPTVAPPAPLPPAAPETEPGAQAPENAAPAQPADEGADHNHITVSLTPRFEHDFSADLKDSNGSSSVSRAGLHADIAGSLGERWRWTLDLDTEASWYNWKDVQTLLPSGRQPLNNAYQVTLMPGLAYAIDKHWGIVGGAIFQITGESDIDLSDSVTYGGYLGARYAFSDKLALTLGIVASTRIENSASEYPLLGVHWQITDKVSLANEGLGFRLSASVSDSVTFSIFGRYERRDYRLQDDGSIPDGVVRDMRWPVGVGLAWQARKSFRLSIDGGVIAYQKFIFDTQNGDRVNEVRTQPQAFIGVSGWITF